MDFQIRAHQDFIFFGRNALESLVSVPEAIEWEWFVKDGDLVCENQTCLTVRSDDASLLDSVLDFLCYLSGGATLARCFVENSMVPVVGCSTKKSQKNDVNDSFWQDKIKNYSTLEETHPTKAASDQKMAADDTLSYWENQAIQAGGASTEPLLPAYICQSEKSFKENARRQEKLFVFDSDYLSPQTIESLIRKLPESTVKGVCGAFNPESCSEFLNLRLQVLWPSLLQGYFPRAEMRVEKSHTVKTDWPKRANDSSAIL